MIYRDLDEILQFQCSPHFKQITKANSTDNNSDQIDFFKATVQSVIQKARENNEPVLNGDGTGFQILPNSGQTWAYKNSKNIANNVLDSTKSRISVMATISNNHEKLPLFIIAGANNEEEKVDLLGQ